MRFPTFLAAALALAACRDRRAADAPAIVEVEIEMAGAQPATVEAAVVEPIEHVVGRLAGVRSVEARSDAGRATLTVEVERTAEGRIAHELQHALAEARKQLPTEAGWPVIRWERGEPLVWLAVRGTLPVAVMSRQVRDDIVPALQRVAGIADVDTEGLAEEHVIVHFDLARLDALGVTLDDIAAELPRARTDVETVAAIAINGVQLRDVATVELGAIRDARDPAVAIRAHAGADRAAVLAEVRRVIAAAGDVELVEVPWPRRRAPLTVTLRGPDRDVLEAAAVKLADTLAARGLANVTRDPPAPAPAATITIDRMRAAERGVAPAELAPILRILAGAPLGAVIMKLDEPDLARAVERVRIRGAGGERVPLASIVDVTTIPVGPLVRRDGEAAISFAIDAPADKLVAARAAVRELALPAGHRATVRSP